MFKKLFGLAPRLEDDGSYTPSKIALKLAAPSKTNYSPVQFDQYTGLRKKILVICTEQKNMKMQNGKYFSTGNHPVETILPMLHLNNAGFEFEIVTPTGKPVVLEMWAMPREDSTVIEFYQEYTSQFENPGSLEDFVEDSFDKFESYAAIFIPGGHGAMLGIPKDTNVGKTLRWALKNDLFTISLCHGPGAFLSTCLDSNEFIYKGYEMAVFPDSVDKQTPMIGYLPGHMPWKLCEELVRFDVSIINSKSDNSTCIDGKLITGASPLAANELGILAAESILTELSKR